MGPMEMFGRDCRGNPSQLLDDRDGSWTSDWAGNPASIDEVFVKPAPKACADDAADEVDSWFGNVRTDGAAQAVKHDSSGHLTDDGYKYRYRYDASGRLTDVHGRSVSGSTVSDGSPVAHYGYNAAGWRTRADYDSNGDGSIDHSDTREYYQYDEQWRLTGIYRTGVPNSEDPDLGCPEGGGSPCLYQVYGYPPSGRTGGGGFPVAMAYRDTPSSRWRDTDCDNQLDERLDILGDAGGSVRSVMQPATSFEGEGVAGGIGTVLERYDYTPFGRPIAQPLGDVNGDGKVDADDLNAVDAAIAAYSGSSSDYAGVDQKTAMLSTRVCVHIDC